ncbi:GNAT family N-acetyltransferase [Salinisphaera hydrothermalis]|uniref:GNAT family N-acetyltransferase n=1 Tax=Salinisphaera hydrothermalis TaxID=563188 RepID=UPI0033400CD7
MTVRAFSFMGDQKKVIRIRKAQQSDAVALYRLLEEAYSDRGVDYSPIDENRLMCWITTTIADGEVWVADRSGRVIGSIALIDFQFPWSANWVLINSWLYVLRNFRARGTGKKLMEAVFASADDKGGAPLVIGTHSGRDTDWKDEFIGGFGGVTYCGGTFFRPPYGQSNHE